MSMTTVLAASALWAGGAMGAEPSAETAAYGASGKRSAAVVRWDGRVVAEDTEIRGLRANARETVERWRTFARKRGYRVDLDESQRVVVVSDAERFRRYSPSATVVDRTLDALAPFSTPSEAPIVVLRASDEGDGATARKAAEALGLDGQLRVYVEEGMRTDRRAVDARLAEAIVRQQLRVDEPYLSEWMADGLASYVAEQTTGRAIVEDEVRTLRSVQSEIERSIDGSKSWRVSLYEVGGVQLEGVTQPEEAQALAIVAFLAEHHADALTAIVSELGRTQTTEGRPKYREEEHALERHVGRTALYELSRALREGRSYRP
ncbi:MAG: hypothetical protein AAGB93_15155 [Planctomycetota bacterium]